MIEPQVYPPASMHEFFAYLPQLQEISGLENLVTDQVTDMSSLFSGDFNKNKGRNLLILIRQMNAYY